MGLIETWQRFIPALYNPIKKLFTPVLYTRRGKTRVWQNAKVGEEKISEAKLSQFLSRSRSFSHDETFEMKQQQFPREKFKSNYSVRSVCKFRPFFSISRVFFFRMKALQSCRTRWEHVKIRLVFALNKNVPPQCHSSSPARKKYIFQFTFCTLLAKINVFISGNRTDGNFSERAK